MAHSNILERPRRLILMRHAQAMPVRGGGSDFLRPLSDQGRIQAQSIGRQLAKLGYRPDWALVSTSIRTQETWDVVNSAWSPSLHQEKTEGFYHGQIEDIQHAVGVLGEEVVTLLCLGHNPGWSGASSAFAGKIIEMGEAHTVVLEGKFSSWEQAVASYGAWVVKSILQP